MYISKKLEERILNVFGTKKVINVQEDRYMLPDLNVCIYSKTQCLHVLNYRMILQICMILRIKKEKLQTKIT